MIKDNFLESLPIDSSFHAYIVEGRAITVEELSQKFSVHAFDIVELTEQNLVQVREFVGALALTPRYSRWRIGLINAADKLTVEAQNTLLKLLEEPPKHAIIILALKINSLLPTIVSRCRVVTVAVPETQDEAEFSLNYILNADLKTNFDLATKIITLDDPLKFVASWLKSARVLLKEDASERNLGIVSGLLELERKLKSNANKKIALESFFLDLYNIC